MGFKTFLLQVVLLFVFVSAWAQDEDLRIKTELDNKEYDRIIKEDGPKARNYTAKATYYIGMAYYLKNDDDNCIKFMNLAIEKDPNFGDAFYIKGMSLSYIEEYEKAIKTLQTAIKIDDTNSDYYTALGDVYYKTEVFDKALEAYQNANKQKKPSARSYTMIPQVYAAQKKLDKALAAFYVAQKNVSKESESYKTVLFNIGLLEILNGNYDKAELALVDLLNIAPQDYAAMSKLIQVYYGKKEYEKATPWKEKLYVAYKAGQLKKSMKNMFCFAQFKWKDKRVEVFEKFEEPVKSGDTKYIFYVVGDNDNIDFKVQLEYEPIFKEQNSPNKYLLCKERSEYHATYSLAYPENPDYENLKKDVTDVLNDKIKPTAETQDR